MPSPIVSVPCDSDSASPDARPNREAGLFMRFKEKYLLPDYRVKSISGASFEGFYYAALLFDDELSKRDGTGRTSGRRTPVPISRTPSSTVGPSSAFSSFSTPLPQPARTSSGSEYSSPSPPPSMTGRSLPHPPDPSTDTPRPHDPPRAPTSPPEERTSAIPGDAVITGASLSFILSPHLRTVAEYPIVSRFSSAFLRFLLPRQELRAVPGALPSTRQGRPSTNVRVCLKWNCPSDHSVFPASLVPGTSHTISAFCFLLPHFTPSCNLL